MIADNNSSLGLFNALEKKKIFFEIPLPLNNVGFYKSKVKHDITVRVYFNKKNVIGTAAGYED